MNYSDDPTMVRVDFFKPSGKWAYTRAVKWLDYQGEVLIHDAFKRALREHFKDRPNSLSDMDAICLAPYHENEHPVMLKAGEWVEK